MTTILVIEDDDNIRDGIVDMLDYGGYHTIQASNGVEGLRAARSQAPDLILCDILMPEMDGYGVLFELSQYEGTANIPFVFLTAKTTHDDMRKGMSMGADDYLTKPFTAPELLKAIKVRLERHQRLAQPLVAQMQDIRRFLNLTLPHELRTPLSGVLGYLFMLVDGVEVMEPEEVRHVLTGMQRSANRLATLVENFIAYSQVQIMAGDPYLLERLREYGVLSDFDILIAQEAEREAYQIGRADDLTVSVEPGGVQVYFDHARKMISSLVNNAFKFSAEGTPVKVHGKLEHPYYILSVSNHGRGMSQEQIARIGANVQFDRERYEQQGAGLGLAITQALMRIYSGSLTIESVPDEVTTVTVRIPAL